ncbi:MULTISPECIES: hypothetical protein [unclassified Duganella]|uniref:hypothetical protein n=1 Tax=unclassified Duganella TaxID=2636909 RepID=UPI000B7F8267|nr:MULTISPECIES: hypothetical protein [unclassified Duganella]
MQIGLTPYLPAIAATGHQEDDFIMEERITKLEATSNSHATAIAAMENDMNDRFNRIEDELSELRQNKADNESTVYRLTNLQREMNRCFSEIKEDIHRCFGEVKEDIERRSVELRAHIDFTTTISRDENERRFTDMRRDFEVRIEMLRSMQERHFEYVDKRFERVDERLGRVESSVADLRKELHIFMRWSLGIHATVVLGVAALLAKAYLG